MIMRRSAAGRVGARMGTQGDSLVVRTDVVHKSMFLRSTPQTPFFRGLTQQRYCTKGEIESPSKLIVGLVVLPKGGGFSSGGGIIMRWVDRTKAGIL